jgi:hypothetical protein
VLTALALLITLPLLWFGYRPMMLFNPITRYLYPQREYNNGTITNLVPGLFQVGEPREKVLSDLKGAGFATVDPSAPWTDELWFSAGANLFCGYEFNVKLSFGPDGGLLRAENVAGGVCL